MVEYNVDAMFVIDLGIEYLHNSEDFYRLTINKRPVYIKFADENIKAAYSNMKRTEDRLEAICDALRISFGDVVHAAKTAKRWYEKTEWMLVMRCSDRLLATLCKPRH